MVLPNPSPKVFHECNFGQLPFIRECHVPPGALYISAALKSFKHIHVAFSFTTTSSLSVCLLIRLHQSLISAFDFGSLTKKNSCLVSFFINKGVISPRTTKGSEYSSEWCYYWTTGQNLKWNELRIKNKDNYPCTTIF